MEVGGSSMIKRVAPAADRHRARPAAPASSTGLMDDRARVAELLGREPAGAFDVVVRDRHRRSRRGPQRTVPRRRHADADALLPRRRRTRPRGEPSRGCRRREGRRGGDRPRRARSPCIAATAPNVTPRSRQTIDGPRPVRRRRRHPRRREVPPRPSRLPARRWRRPRRPLGPRAHRRGTRER